MLRVGWILVGDEQIASARIMGINVHKWMCKNDITSEIISQPRRYSLQLDLKPYLQDRLLDYYDVFIFQKVCLGDAVSFARKCQDKGKRVIYIVDDLFVECMGMAEICDTLVVGSEYLAQKLFGKLKGKSVIVQDAYETPRSLHKRDYSSKIPLRITFFGTLLHLPHAEQVRPVIESLGYEYITISGEYPADKIWRLDTIWDDILESDIIVIPILGEISNYDLAKGENKLVQSMILGLPTIASPIPSYFPIINQGVNGFICHANTQKEWTRYLRMLADKNLRQSIGRNARETVIEHWSINSIGNKWLEIINDKN